MINAIIYVISTLLTYILGIISKKTGFHETLPIPIQNIIVGIFCFVGAMIFSYIFKQSIDAENIIEQIIVALGGAGTATLGYDTQKS